MNTQQLEQLAKIELEEVHNENLYELANNENVQDDYLQMIDEQEQAIEHFLSNEDYDIEGCDDDEESTLA